MALNAPKTLTLDLATWICGLPEILRSDSATRSLGRGRTRLLNFDGCMCCLGQFSRQCGATDAQLLDRGLPDSSLPGHAWFDATVSGHHVPFSAVAVSINDDSRTTVAEKLKQLRRLCKEAGIKLLIRNSNKKGLRYGETDSTCGGASGDRDDRAQDQAQAQNQAQNANS